MTCILFTSAYLVFMSPVSALNPSTCRHQEQFDLNGVYKTGDLIIGGIFHINFEVSIFQRLQTMLFAIAEINRDQTLLPNITLGYRVYDNCVKLPVALRAATALIGGLDNDFTDSGCSGPPPVVAIVGDPLSSHSIAISRILSLFQMPLVSYSASCSCLSNKIEYPTFFRTVPSDAFQVKAMVQIIKHYGWTWVGAIASDDDYGQYALRAFQEEIKTFGCISFIETVTTMNDNRRVFQIVDTIQQSTAKVIVVFSAEAELLSLVKEIVHQNITGRQWIASEAWSTSAVFATKENFGSFGGTIGIAIRRGEIQDLESFLYQIRPKFDLNNNLLLQFWEKIFDCHFQETTIKTNTTLSSVMIAYNVYKAVYALAHALHDLMSCQNGKGPFENNECADIKNMQPYQVKLLHYLKSVNFTNRLGERVSFDENGDAPAIYDIVNWQMTNNGSVKIKTIGLFDESASAGKEVPESICSKSCLPGTRRANRKGQPVCCFDCIPCAEGEISYKIGEYTEFYNPNTENFLSYEDAMGITLTTVASVGSFISVGVLAIFIYHRNTPVVRANNSELSFLLLISLTLCFLCALCFIGKPSDLNCMLRHVMFGISFVLCISCILVKTIVVIMAFRATLPGNNTMKWFSVSKQRGTVFFFTFIQSIICIIWLASAPPYPYKNTKYQNAIIIIECDVGSSAGFGCLLGYIGLLACICFLLAFLARNLPDSFNEAKFITFSMLIFCAVWITFIPAYISSPGKHTVAVEIFAILASSFGLLFAIFAPKCYIILLKPEQNTKKTLMGRGTNEK
uniref:Extracellular calcium-sensing receptor-like n=1 Tax=Erpetoichthys calabaricus TaxID=27687 RepID=A0A8C4TCP6_ERPCA